MGQLNGVDVEKLQGGLGRLATGTDNHVAMIVSGLPVGAVATAVNNAGKGVVLTSVFDAEQLGINESLDSNNSITVYRDIVEFFRLAPEATLYLFNSVVEADLKTFINQNKEIKGYGVCITWDEGDEETDPNMLPAIALHQKIINDFAAVNRLLDFAVIGVNGLDVFTEDLFALTAPQVSVCVACMDDSGIVAIGSALAMIAVRKINENLGSVDIIKKPLAKRGFQDYSLTDALLDVWAEAYLSDGSSVNEIDDSQLDALLAKGYIVAASYEGYPGFFFSDSCTCIDRASDFGFIENNRTWNKAARIIRMALLPRVKGVVKKDPSTGFIASTTVSSWTGDANKALEQMVINEEISGFEVFIDQKQVVNSTNAVKVKAMVVADGIVHKFEVAVGLTNSI